MAARALNKVMLIGNLTRDPEVRYTGSGAAVATFGVATNKTWKDSDGTVKEAAEFHNIVAWGKMAEICQQLLAKGMKVYVEGSLSTRSWEGEDGNTRYKTEVRIDDMILLDSKGRQGGVSTPEVVEESDSQKEVSEEEVLEEVKEEVLEDDSSSKDEDPLDEDLPF